MKGNGLCANGVKCCEVEWFGHVERRNNEECEVYASEIVVRVKIHMHERIADKGGGIELTKGMSG